MKLSKLLVDIIEYDYYQLYVKAKGIAYTIVNPPSSLLVKIFIYVFVAGVAYFVLAYLATTRLVRMPFARTYLGGTVFCSGNELCEDGRCVGETWKECETCPTGTAQSVYKVSCGTEFKSNCTIDSNMCLDHY